MSPREYVELMMDDPNRVLNRIYENLEQEFGVTNINRNQIGYHFRGECNCGKVCK